MKKKTLLGLLTIVTVLVFLFSACGGTGTVLLPITIEEIEGNWNLELNLVEGADARNNDELYGAFEIELNDSDELESIKFVIFGQTLSRKFSMNGTLFDAENGNYQIKGQKFTFSNNGPFWTSEGTIEKTINGYTGELFLTYSDSQNDTDYNFTFQGKKEESIDYKLFEKTWSLKDWSVNTALRDSDVIGVLEIPNSLGIGDQIFFQYQDNLEKFNITSITKHEPRILALLDSEKNNFILLRYNEDGTVMGKVKSDNSYHFSGEYLDIPFTDNDLTGIWEGKHLFYYSEWNTSEQVIPCSLTIGDDQDRLSVENNFNVPVTKEINNNNALLSSISPDGWQFNATYTCVNEEKTHLFGEVARTSPEGRIDKWKGYFEKYTSEYTSWAQDVEYFRDTLPEKHINLFFKVTEQEFNQACDDLIEIANTVSEAEVFLGLKEILALIDDVHTNTWGFWNYQTEYYPFEFKKIGNEHYVFSTSDGYEEYLGAKLTSINGNNIEQIRHKTEKIIPAENDIRVDYETPSYLNSPEALEYCEVVEKNSENFVLERDGSQVVVEPDRLTKNQYYNNRANLNWTPSIAEKNTHLNFWYDYLEEDSILYFQYNKCRDHTEAGLPKFAEVQEELIEILENNNVEKFVADFRYNPGGSNTNGTNLAKALGEMNVGTDFYVIIGNQTFSSAIINSLDFRNYCDALLIGEPSSAKPNGYGEVKMFQLPNSGLTVQYSTKYFQLVDEDIEYLAPDIPVYRDFNDYINGVDTVLEHIKGL